MSATTPPPSSIQLFPMASNMPLMGEDWGAAVGASVC